MSGLLTRKINPALPRGPTETSPSYVKFVNAVSIASALAPFADAGSVLRVPSRASQLPPKTVQRSLHAESNFSTNALATLRSPNHGNQLTRRCCEPNGTSVTSSRGFVDDVGLAGGSNACVPRQPSVQSE